MFRFALLSMLLIELDFCLRLTNLLLQAIQQRAALFIVEHLVRW